MEPTYIVLDEIIVDHCFLKSWATSRIAKEIAHFDSYAQKTVCGVYGAPVY